MAIPQTDISLFIQLTRRTIYFKLQVYFNETNILRSLSLKRDIASCSCYEMSNVSLRDGHMSVDHARTLKYTCTGCTDGP